MNEDSKYLMAGHPQASVNELELLASSAWPRVRRRVAENPNSPTHVLILLSKDSDPEVRMSVTNNANVTLPILEWLANDESADVRHYLAEDQNLPRTLLRKLSEDENPFVARQAQLTFVKVAQSKFLNQTENSPGQGQPMIGGQKYDVPRFLRSILGSVSTKPIATTCK